MGISIDVDSLVTPTDRHTFGPPNYQDYQYAELRKLREAFGWASAPWPEPSPVRGVTQTSCNSIRYYRLLGVARAYAQSTAFHVYNEEQPPEVTTDEARIFPHLLIRANWINYYLPVEFDQPQLYEGVWGTVSAGSTIRLHNELKLLATAIPDFRKQVETDLNDSDTTAAEAIHDAGELCELLLVATRESITLNLPLLLRG
jgi:hypothetical protein